MKNIRKHKSRLYTWEQAFLVCAEFWFDSLFEAIEHANSYYCHTVKIYDEFGDLVHSYGRNPEESYA